MKTLLALLVGGLSTCSTFTNSHGDATTYAAKGVCGGVELVAINHQGDYAHARLQVWPEGIESYVDETPVNSFQHDIRPFEHPEVVNDWQLTIVRDSGEVLFTSRVQRSMPC